MSPLPLVVPVWLALPTGIAFGAILERAGLGSARVIARQLSFTDWTVVKVMFSAIVTAMVLLFWSSHLGWVDVSRVAMPETDVIPQLIGSVIFGVGFALAALCPGTACVSAATGRRDGLTAVLGIAVGSIVTAELWTNLGSAAESAPVESATLSSSLGVSGGVIVLGISMLAVAAFVVAERIERPAAMADRRTLVQFISKKPILVLLTLAMLAALGRERPTSRETLTAIATEISREADHVDALQLADWIRERRANVRVVEVVESLAEVDSDAYVIPGATIVPLSEIPGLPLAASDTLVLYSAGGTHAAQAWVLLRANSVRSAFVLRDGFAAWEDEVLSPVAPSDSSKAALARYQHARELQHWFGGTASQQGGDGVARSSSGRNGAPVRRRRNTC